jgi:hypothetical protein
VWKIPALSMSTSTAELASQLDIADNAALQLTRHTDATVQWRSGITPADAQDVRLLEQVSSTVDKRKITHSISSAHNEHPSGDSFSTVEFVYCSRHSVAHFVAKVNLKVLHLTL